MSLTKLENAIEILIEQNSTLKARNAEMFEALERALALSPRLGHMELILMSAITKAKEAV
ncbi:MAG: hypothetical protein ABIU85_02240 [Methylotenera sp.]